MMTEMSFFSLIELNSY